MQVKNVWILKGEGIECELESYRFFESLKLGVSLKPQYVSMADLRASGGMQKFKSAVAKGDLIFLPGGFSFADHFGSGRLLAYELKQLKFVEMLLEKKAHAMGVCNGFQTLARLGLFGDLRLEDNAHHQGFINRWVHLKAFDLDLKLPVRHGEGNAQFEKLEGEAFLTYQDSNFDNGSKNKMAGCIRKIESSFFIGMMPHPEVALRSWDEPYFVPMEQGNGPTKEASGVALMTKLLELMQ